ncbi:MAG: DUF362 domain-containing protein [Melioribacteraceae bacterium]|nr:MAG: DUF362 domain-containing protein [Melioribacteraceae bacterium]
MNSEKTSSVNSSRRKFLKKSSLSILGLSFIGAMPNFSQLSSILKNKSKVVLVKHSKVIKEEGEVNNLLLDEMLERALTTFSGDKTSALLWKKLFSQREIIGLKVNTLGLSSIEKSSGVNHYGAIINSILQSASKASLKNENFIVWDRSSDELRSAGLTVQKENGKTKIFGTTESYKSDTTGLFSDPINVGDKTTTITKILTETCSALINIPVLKDHQSAGFTGALKNHYGTISNPRDFHANNCTSPGIPEINALPEIRNKQKLIIADALMGVFNGGPRWNRSYMWPYGGILVGVDPVAVDTVMLGIINEKRKLEGMPIISDSTAKHIQLSAELGLGSSNLEDIELIKIEMD